MLLRVDHASDTDSTDSHNGGSRRTTSTSGNTAPEGSEAQRGQREHYRGITFEEILPPQFISNAPAPTVETKRRSVRHPKPANADGPPATSVSLTSEPPAKRNYPSAKQSDSKSGGGGGGSKSRIRNTARALVRGLSMAKKRDAQGYEAV